MKSPVEKYLAKRAVKGPWRLFPTPTTGIAQAVVIPALAEGARLFDTLNDLAANDPTELARTLVIVVINNRALPYAREEDIADNLECLTRLEKYADSSSLRLTWVNAASPGLELPEKEGVGLARKIGLDLALEVLHHENVYGPLISVDGDTRLGPEYLRVVAAHFAQPKQPWAAIVNYAHPLDGAEPERTTILNYEIFLRAHELGLRRAGSPYAFPTIGSTIVCSTRAYVAAGGMRRKQAAEDFYFLQDLAKTGPISRITGTTVCPAARASHRVPFGTGATLEKQEAQMIYHPKSYQVLEHFLGEMACFINQELSGNQIVDNTWPEFCTPSLREFLLQYRFADAWDRILDNTPTLAGRHAQFHRWFDALRTLRLFHHLRDYGYPDQPLYDTLPALLQWSDIETKLSCEDLKKNPATAEQTLQLLREVPVCTTSVALPPQLSSRST